MARKKVAMQREVEEEARIAAYNRGKAAREAAAAEERERAAAEKEREARPTFVVSHGCSRLSLQIRFMLGEGVAAVHVSHPQTIFALKTSVCCLHGDVRSHV